MSPVFYGAVMDLKKMDKSLFHVWSRLFCCCGLRRVKNSILKSDNHIRGTS
jgi:hypothetical protein